jgi:hypothetical protein
MALALTATAAAADKPMFEASTEKLSASAKRPPVAVATLVTGSLDKSDRDTLDQCLAENSLKAGDYAALLSSVQFEPAPGVSLYFVRPALDPYCFALYGAHLFRYFLVEAQAQPSGPARYRIVFAEAGDRLAIYSRASHGLYDIEPTTCTAGECWSTRLRFNGADYLPVSCSHTKFIGGGRSVTETVRCEADDEG